MASTEAKARRRAEALNELGRLSGLLSERLNINVPNMRSRHSDPELQSIKRIEAVNELLAQVVDAVSGATKDDTQLEQMTKAELIDLAGAKGVDVSKSAKKAEIIEALGGVKGSEE